MVKQYNPDKHHPSNWCKVCGFYYCWHEEANDPECTFNLEIHTFVPAEKVHPPTAADVEAEEDL
jgi:hypothetical protein